MVGNPSGGQRLSSSGSDDERSSVNLRDLFPAARYLGAEDIVAHGVSVDPDHCAVGDVVVIDSDLDLDPVNAASIALARGAAGLICESLLPSTLPQCLVRNAKASGARLAHVLAGEPAKSVFTVGIIGAAGKTSTAILIANVLRTAGVRTAFLTGLGDSDGVLENTSDSEIHNPCAFADWMAEARDAGCGTTVIELSEAMLRGGAIEAIELDLLVITGAPGSTTAFGPSLMDLALERLSPSGVAVVSSDCPKAVQCVDEAGIQRVTYGMRREADISAKIFEQLPGQTTLLVSAGGCTAAMETQITGPAMATNQLAAIAVGFLTEMPLEQSIEAVARVRQIPGRMERITGYDHASVVIDVAGNSHRLGETLRGLRRERGDGRLWCIVSTAPGTDQGTCSGIGAVAQRYADHVIITSGVDGKAGFLEQAHAILDGVRNTATPRLIADRQDAIEYVIERANRKDTILISGGYPMNHPAAHRRALLQDRQTVDQSRENRQAKQPPVAATLPFPVNALRR